MKTSNAKVIYLKTPINPIFRDLKKETYHHCRVISNRLKIPMKIYEIKNTTYCMIGTDHSVIKVTKQGENLFLHDYQFSNTSPTERESFIAMIGDHK